MIDWKKTQYKKFLFSFVAIGIVLRLASVGILGQENQNTWEYGTIAKNMANDKGFSFYYFVGNDIESEYNPTESPAPSAYMAPGYVFTLYLFETVSPDGFFKPLVTLFNLFLFTITILLLFNFTSWLTNEKAALFGVIIYSLVPEFIYTTYSLGATQIYHFFIISIFYMAIVHKSKSDTFLAVVFGIAILFRFELILLLVLFAAYYIFKKSIKKSLLLIIIPTLFLSPWVIRNHIVFDEFIPTSTTGGLNLFRGNNDVIIGGWHNFETLEKVRRYDGDENMIEIYLNQMYMEEAVRYINEDYLRTATNFAKKFFFFWVLNPDEDESTNIIYFVPWFLLLSLSLMGLYKNRKKNDKLVLLYLSYHSILAIIFIPLLRYQTMMKIMLIPFAAYGVYILFENKSK